MHFGTKNYLKSNRNHIAKFSLSLKKLHFRKYYKIILENSLNNLNLFCWTNLWQLLGFFSSVLQINDLEGLIIPLLLLIQSKNSSCGWWFSNYNFIISAFCLLFFLAVAYYKMKGELVLLTKVLLFMPETNKKNCPEHIDLAIYYWTNVLYLYKSETLTKSSIQVTVKIIKIKHKKKTTILNDLFIIST